MNPIQFSPVQRHVTAPRQTRFGADQKTFESIDRIATDGNPGAIQAVTQIAKPLEIPDQKTFESIDRIATDGNLGAIQAVTQIAKPLEIPDQKTFESIDRIATDGNPGAIKAVTQIAKHLEIPVILVALGFKHLKLKGPEIATFFQIRHKLQPQIAAEEFSRALDDTNLAQQIKKAVKP